MMAPAWWIPNIDWRISTGIIFFIQLLIWRTEERKKAPRTRLLLSLLLLCGSSFVMRYFMETRLTGRFMFAAASGIYVLVLCLLFLFCYRFCYHCPTGTLIFQGVLAVTVYRMSWNALKLISSLPFGRGEAWTLGSPIQSVMSYLLYLAVALISYRLYRHFVREAVDFPLKSVMTLYVVTVLFQMILELSYQVLYVYNESKAGWTLFFFTALLYCMISYYFLIVSAYLAVLRRENDSMKNFIASKQRYYEISREGILSLQIKCHDLKHQIARIRSAAEKQEFEKYLNRLVDTIDEYNTVIESGNKTLDVVLTEKNIICTMNHVRFTYIIDGTLFSFLTDMEIYALFGNIMDNALESMESVTCPEKKYISLKAAKRGSRVILMVENYFEHALEFEDGLPVTNKDDREHHGFGLRSIVEVARHHGGDASVFAENHIFKLTVFMQPEEV